MSYRVNASSSDGATSMPAFSLEKAGDMAEELKTKGYMNIVIMDAGTGKPVSTDVHDAAGERGDLAE